MGSSGRSSGCTFKRVRTGGAQGYAVSGRQTRLFKKSRKHLRELATFVTLDEQI